MSAKQEESEITRERVLRLFNHLTATMKDHEKMCMLCSYWVREDGMQRCDEYQHMREARWKWGKKYDDWGIS